MCGNCLKAPFFIASFLYVPILICSFQVHGPLPESMPPVRYVWIECGIDLNEMYTNNVVADAVCLLRANNHDDVDEFILPKSINPTI